jgi:hypothetical protein
MTKKKLDPEILRQSLLIQEAINAAVDGVQKGLIAAGKVPNPNAEISALLTLVAFNLWRHSECGDELNAVAKACRSITEIMLQYIVGEQATDQESIH